MLLNKVFGNEDYGKIEVRNLLSAKNLKIAKQKFVKQLKAFEDKNLEEVSNLKEEYEAFILSVSIISATTPNGDALEFDGTMLKFEKNMEEFYNNKALREALEWILLENELIKKEETKPEKEKGEQGNSATETDTANSSELQEKMSD